MSGCVNYFSEIALSIWCYDRNANDWFVVDIAPTVLHHCYILIFKSVLAFWLHQCIDFTEKFVIYRKTVIQAKHWQEFDKFWVFADGERRICSTDKVCNLYVYDYFLICTTTLSRVTASYLSSFNCHYGIGYAARLTWPGTWITAEAVWVVLQCVYLCKNHNAPSFYGLVPNFLLHVSCT